MLSVSVRLSSTVSVSLMWHVGLDPDGVKDGRIKMAGVTAAFSAGATAEDLMHAGRWRTPPIALHYKHNSVSFKRAVAAKIPSLPYPRLSSSLLFYPFYS